MYLYSLDDNLGSDSRRLEHCPLQRDGEDVSLGLALLHRIDDIRQLRPL